MNLQELLDEMAAHSNTILVELLPDEDFGFYLFVRVTYISSAAENEANQEAVCIIVDDRGGPAETAYYKGKPTYMKSIAFRSTVEIAAANYQQNNPAFEYYSIDTVDEAQEFAIVRAYVFDSGTNLSDEKRFIVFKEDAQLKMRELKPTVSTGM